MPAEPTPGVELIAQHPETSKTCAASAGRHPLDPEPHRNAPPELRSDIRDSLIAQITDPARFGGKWLLPTVARDDPDFSPERMWRGPIWVNTAWLVIQGLRVQGEDALADRVTENVLDLVMHAGGQSEYFNPDGGQKTRTATVLLGWSSALFVEMAVGGSPGRSS